MNIIREYNEPASPRLVVSLGGKEYSGTRAPKSFQVTSSLSNLYDGFSFDLDNSDGRNGDLLDLNAHRWHPIVIRHADPYVEQGRPLPMVMGVVTRIEQATSDGPSTITISGYDLGKLLDSGAIPWYRIRGKKWQQLTEDLIDKSWKRAQGPVTDDNLLWGIQGITGLYRDRFVKMGKRVFVGKIAVIQDYGHKYQQFVPPLQIEPGETVGDTLTRYAKLTGYQDKTISGSLVSVSADGWLQIFNPDDGKDDPPAYSFTYSLDTRNTRIKSAHMVRDGEGLYTDYRIYGSVITRPGDPNKRDSYNPNATKFYATASNPGYLKVNRLSASSDGELYDSDYALARAQWRQRQGLYGETTLTYVVQGHSWPDPNGQWIPLVEGNVAEVNDYRNRVHGRMLVEAVTKELRDAPQGATTRVVLRPLGLLGA